jgi:RNA polymerase sigma factor (sigma-70 family)
MAQINRDQDYALVKQCIAGSEEAWQAFYAKYIGLMRNVVRKYSGLSQEDSQDIVQSAFLALTSALNGYDPKNSLAHFICVITERALIDELRRAKAAKRRAETQAIEHCDNSDETALDIASTIEPQDSQLEKAELAEKLKVALDGMDDKCRELIRLRYYKELSFAEIAAILGTNENTVNVQTRRCLQKLKTRCNELE